MKKNIEPIAVIAGSRTPFAKAYSKLASVPAVQLGTAAVTNTLGKAGLGPNDVDEIVIGNVSGPAESANVARAISMMAGIPNDRIAHTVNRNCGSGMESIISAAQIIRDQRARIVIAGGTESMSNIPLLVSKPAAALLTQLNRARNLTSKLKLLAQFRPKHLRPTPAVMLGLTDPVCGLNMGETAELLAKEFSITRADQDAYALESHKKASAAIERCFMSGEVCPFECNGKTMDKDNGPRENQSLEQLQKLRPIFDASGTVTPGNSCPLTDGAAAVVLASPEDEIAKERVPLGYVTAYSIAGCDPRRMGLGPVYATHKLLKQTGLSLSNFDLLEINEAFAAQVLACIKAMESPAFAKQEFGDSRAIGTVARDRLNVNGGAIAIGHPVGTTGTRMVITLLRSLRENGYRRGLATLCIGGGQGMAMVVETTCPNSE